ncbi:MAG: peptidoglycan-binding protein [Methylococcaceae bacterium]|nr:peptidoglycan-binding protein [Methylococcaceae bacterium]MDD1609373.1 peptidoglycan-binding protein [Methylococcaceae bacterium]MDD1616930.1 peptidoglycan-binding protein [Methylococcaceae bacterium]OYV16456.1 MAG: Uncharacterized protein CG439_2105 [Methylococcaceae bacterium NSP1-2]
MNDLILVKNLKRGDQHGQVKLIQEWLCLHKEIVGTDGDFGPATERAVKDFQSSNGIAATGIVDNNTFEKLVAPMNAALMNITPAAGSSLGDLVVAYARQHLKQHPREVGGQNRGPWVRLYMNGNEGEPWAWCAGFVCFCLKQACKTLDQKTLPITPSFSCDDLAASAKKNKIFVNHNAIKPGSLFLVRRTDTDWTHTGIVISVDSETCKTIEGNTNDDGSREGYEVCMRTRAYTTKLDFIRI